MITESIIIACGGNKQAAVRGAVIGTTVGFILGGPVTAIVGGSLSAVLSGLFGTTIDKISGRMLKCPPQ